MKALDYILSHYGRYDNYENFHEKTVFKSLLFTLDMNELNILDKKLKTRSEVIIAKEEYENEQMVIRSIRKTIELIKENSIKERNESISTLLNLFVNKNSGKVCETRKKLQSRYEFQSYQVQGKILKTFLHSSKTDRKWAYRCLLKQWHKTLSNDVLELWEKFHEDDCAIVLIKYGPENYLPMLVYDLMESWQAGEPYPMAFYQKREQTWNYRGEHECKLELDDNLQQYPWHRRFPPKQKWEVYEGKNPFSSL
jgi:hypothetical protein